MAKARARDTEGSDRSIEEGRKEIDAPHESRWQHINDFILAHC